jgi:heat shock protein HspQ
MNRRKFLAGLLASPLAAKLMPNKRLLKYYWGNQKAAETLGYKGVITHDAGLYYAPYNPHWSEIWSEIGKDIKYPFSHTVMIGKGKKFETVYFKTPDGYETEFVEI